MPLIPYNGAYAYSYQPILASALIQKADSDPFYFPESNNLTGYAFNGVHYTNGAADSPPHTASWFSEGAGLYRGGVAGFPAYGLILLGRASLAILDESTPALNLWMTFLFHDNLLLTDNFAFYNTHYANDLQGWLPRRLQYANGIVSIVYVADPGAITINSTMVVNLDFTRDTAYLDVAV